MNQSRNRSEGWQWAKCSGHRNEDIATEHVRNDQDLQRRILKCAHKEGAKIIDIQVGGLNETGIDSVLGDKTKSKTDLHLILNDNSTINISLKKCPYGHVFFISVSRFIKGFGKQFNKIIPDDIKRAMYLFWGEAEDVLDISKKYNKSGEKIKKYEESKHRLVKETLDNYNKNLCEKLLNWFNENMLDIMTFCFSTGLANDESDWANIIWWRNYVGEYKDLDSMFNLDELKKCNKSLESAYFGNRNGGTTIQLPFGSVMWHQNEMLFHDNINKLKKILNPK